MQAIKNMPQHVVAIPDGNRSWAKQRKQYPWLGHRAGAKNLEKILEVVRDINLPCFSFWGMSKDNFQKRSKTEVKYLLEILRAAAVKLAKHPDIHKHQVKVNIFGAWPQLFPPRSKKAFLDLIEATKDYDQRFINFLICYNGKDEMISAVKNIVSKAKKQKNIKVTDHLIKANLWTHQLPPVDLVIRTGVQNDPHLSAGLLMWDTADAQLYFSNKTWPDFNKAEFTKAIKDYQKRERRFGA